MEHLIVFTRYPEPGQTKTRLIPALGIEGAAKLHRQMTEKAIATVDKLQELRPISTEIKFTGTTLSQMQDWLGCHLCYNPQVGGNLGERMSEAFQSAFNRKYRSVVMIGSDCPAITSHILSQAFQLLQQFYIVLGPATDGGYYLIGLSRFIPEIFEGVNWGTELVWKQTISICHHLNIAVANLTILTDIDRPEDLEKLTDPISEII